MLVFRNPVQKYDQICIGTVNNNAGQSKESEKSRRRAQKEEGGEEEEEEWSRGLPYNIAYRSADTKNNSSTLHIQGILCMHSEYTFG